MPVIRENESTGAGHGEGDSLPIHTLEADRIRYLPEEEVTTRERGAARIGGLYTMLGLRVAVHTDGAPEITAEATNTKGVVPCDGSGSSSVARHKDLTFRVRLDPDGTATVRLMA